MPWRRHFIDNSFVSHECLEFLARKCPAIITDDLFYNSNWPNICLNTSVVLDAVMEFITCTSGHFESASTAMRNMFPIKGPAKSI